MYGLLRGQPVAAILFHMEDARMFPRSLIVAATLFAAQFPAHAATPPGNVQAGKDLVTRSCITCHAPNETRRASDTAPPLSFLARDNKERPAWIRGWLMDPHPPMPGIMLSRQQINDIIAYLGSLPAQ